MAKKSIPSANRSPHGWWIGTYVERFALKGERRSNPNRRCHAYENTVLIRASDREEAYRKLVAVGRAASGTTESGPPGIDCRAGRWRFEGVSELLPIYEPLEDGAEICWHHHRNIAVKTINNLTKRKSELAGFDDAT